MCGISSRRKAEDLVRSGRVRVNARMIDDLATKIDPLRDRVYVDEQEVARVHDYIYLVMNKPKDTITTVSDERGRHTVMELVKSKRRVYPIGRLDRHTTGILLLTNDGEFSHNLMHPRRQVPKSYHVTLDQAVAREHLRQIAAGIKLSDGVTTPAECFLIPGSKSKEVGITIHEGRNRQVRRVFEHFNYEVVKLDRVAYGPVTKEGLGRGAVRKLTPMELRELRRLAGMDDANTWKGPRPSVP
jgi:23S rRNA pseudouridine2605 synthase